MMGKRSRLSRVIGLGVLCLVVMVQSFGCRPPADNADKPPETFRVAITPGADAPAGTLPEMWVAEVADPMGMSLAADRSWYCVDSRSGATFIWKRPLLGYGEVVRVEATSAVSATGITGGVPLALSLVEEGLAIVICRDLDPNMANRTTSVEWYDARGERVWSVAYARLDTQALVIVPSISLSPDNSALLVCIATPPIDRTVAGLEPVVMRVEASGDVAVSRKLPATARMVVDWEGGKALLAYRSATGTQVDLIDTVTLATLSSSILDLGSLDQIVLIRSAEGEARYWLGGSGGCDLLAADLAPLWSIRGPRSGFAAAATGWAVAWTATDCAQVTPAGEVAWSRPYSNCLAGATAPDGSLTVLIAGSEDGSPKGRVDIVSAEGKIVSSRTEDMLVHLARPVAAAPGSGRVFAAWGPHKAALGNITAGDLKETAFDVTCEFARGLVAGQGRYVLLESWDRGIIALYDLEAATVGGGG
jgi:hypothetical protein